MKYRSSYICLGFGAQTPAVHRPLFLQWRRLSIWLTNQYTKINTIHVIALVNITIFVWTDRFLVFFLIQKQNLIETLKTIYDIK